MKFFLLFILSVTLNAEIQSVRLQFNPVACQANCGNLLIKYLQRVQGVENVAIDPRQGVVKLTYAPGSLFSFSQINTAVRSVGPNLEWIELVVKGQVEVTGKAAFLVSDKNRFEILSAGGPQGNGRFVEFNRASHNLNQEQLEQLLLIANKKETVEITGPLFQPERSPPYRIIMLKMTGELKE
jgi:hypothetical protein